MKRQKASNRFRTQLQIEALEQRQLMAGLTATLNQSTKTLTITGTDQADVVAITQNDATNRVTVVSGLSGLTTQHFAANLVNRVIVQLGSGDDQLPYKTIRDVWNRKDIQVDFGSGDDTGTVQWAEDGGTARTNLNLAVYGAAGSDAFGARIGRAGFNTTTNVQADMGAGDDGFVVQALNPDSLMAKLSISALGGDGDDELQYFASGSLAWSASSTIRLDGQAGDDSLTFSNQGRTDGELKETMLGGTGNDSISTEAVEGTGNGKYGLSVEGNEGDDLLIVDVRAAGNRTYKTQTIVDGGTGDDASFTPTTTTVINVESNSLVTPQTRPTPNEPQAVINAIKEMVRKTEISGILAEVAAKYGVPGLSASVIIGDRIITGAAGVRVAGTTAAVRITDRFGVGSDTKAMTATLAGILVERGVLRWDSTLSQLFPELRASMQTAYLNVTIEQLLQHRGGIVADDDASEQLAEKVAAYTGPASQSRLVLLPEILKESLPGAVGEFRYSNAGYAAAAAMMERATGVPYERLMQRYIFNPLGMYSATFDPPVSDPTNPRQPIGHLPDGTPAPGDRPPADYLGDVLRPAGADLRMNVTDWSKFVRVHLGESINGFRLVKPETLARLQLSVKITGDEPSAGYAMGWGVFPAKSIGLDARYGRILNHLGSDGVWLAEVDAFPDVDFSIQIMANGTLDKNGNDLESGAFDEIKLRLFHRFAPKFGGELQRLGTNLVAPAIERESARLNSQLATYQNTITSTFDANRVSKQTIQRNDWQTAGFFSGKARSLERIPSSPAEVKNLRATITDAAFADLTPIFKPITTAAIASQRYKA